jgi:hypothetical protein
MIQDTHAPFYEAVHSLISRCVLAISLLFLPDIPMFRNMMFSQSSGRIVEFIEDGAQKKSEVFLLV